jgi:tyrosine-protein kinase Etk/Wzc
VENQRNIKLQPSLHSEGLDLNKLAIIIRNNWYWLALIFFLINSLAYLTIRYTKNVYESESVLKLDLNENASELGIKSIVEDQNINHLAGEIDLIQSELFLSRVLDSLNINVSYVSVGRLLDEELFGDQPFFVSYTLKSPAIYNTRIYFDEDNETSFTLRIGDQGQEIKGNYGSKLSLDAIDLVIQKNSSFVRGDEVGYYFVIYSEAVLLNNLLTQLKAEPLNYRSNTIRISFRDNNRFKANAVISKIDTLYLHYSNEQKNLANRQKIDWLTNELHLIEKRMEDFENYFEDFTLQNKTNDINDDLKKTVAAINRIDSQRYDVSRRLTETSRLLEGVHSGDFYITLLQRQLLPPALQTNLEELQKTLLQQQKLNMSYTESTLAYREKQKETQTLTSVAINQLTELKVELTKRMGELNQQKARLEREFALMPDKNTQFSKNERFYKLYEEFYLTLMQSKSEFEIAQAGSTPDFKILSPATLPQSPISPKKLMLTGIGFIASIVAVIFFTGLLYLINNKITNISELERVSSVSVLGVVPASAFSNDAGLHVVNHPKSMVSEAIRTLRTNLDFFTNTTNGEKKVIAISSTVSGEGKSFIALNLGGVIALSKKRVILLDLDMRKAKNTVPSDDNTKGISTVLIRKHSWQECVLKTHLENFDFIPSGPHPPNPSELLLNGEFTEILDELKKNYDFIILDTPPVGLVTDGIMAMRRADVSIYVFRANYSKKEFLHSFRRIVNINKFTNVTTVLNAVTSTGGKSNGYGYYEEPSRSGRFTAFFKK